MTPHELARHVYELPEGPLEVFTHDGERYFANEKRFVRVVQNGLVFVYPPPKNPLSDAGRPAILHVQNVADVRPASEGVAA